ncbi:MAG: hydrogenase iron-sulfur subunit [Rhodospirillaceae bacterium]|nr:hydrogenase iron-sulfur subunit [Rhodospirillaceae bacterium]
MQQPLRNFFQHIETFFDGPFDGALNPMRQLGSLAFFLYWIVAGSGIYIYIFFDTSVSGAYESVEWMTNQWYLAGIMRSLHRYASDAMVVVAMVHLLREFSYGRYVGARWFAWFTGVPIIWFLFFSGVSGYWLVWDMLAQYVAIGSMEWLDWLGIFGKQVANNFLSPITITDRFFTLLVFIHIFVPLFLLFIMWFHVMRLKSPRINPPKMLMISVSLALVVLSLVYPATSHEKADLSAVALNLDFDWFYLIAYPLFDAIGPGPMWAVGIGVTILVSLVPLLNRTKREPAAFVSLEKCNGCSRCASDCPYDAIEMKPRTDGLKFDIEAVVDANACVACGICVGACPVSTPFRHDEQLVTGIDLPEPSLKSLRDSAVDTMNKTRAKAGQQNAIMVFGCKNGVNLEKLNAEAKANNIHMGILQVPCSGMLPPSFIDFAISRGSMDGVVVMGCSENGCYHRFGQFWTEDRINQLRDPNLRTRVPRERLATIWANPTNLTKALNQVSDFNKKLSSLPAQQEPSTASGGDK